MEFQHSKKLPYLSEYLAYEVKKAEELAIKPNIGASLAILVGIVAAILLPIPFFLKFLLVAGAIAGSVIINNVTRKPKTAAEIDQERFKQTLAPYLKLAEYRRLHRNIDSTAMQLLEASAYYWSLLRMQLNSATWNSESTPLHLRAVRVQTLEAIDAAMREQVELCARCIIPLGSKPKTDLREVLEDVIGVDVQDVLENLKKGMKTKSDMQSARLPEIFEPSRAIAEKLKLLSQEMTTIASESAGSTRLAAGSSLDSALKDLQDLKTAYVELDQT